MHVTRHDCHPFHGNFHLISAYFILFSSFRNLSVPRRTGRAGQPIGISPLRNTAQPILERARESERRRVPGEIISSCLFVLILRNRISSCTGRERGVGDQCFSPPPAGHETHPLVLFPADLFQSSLHAIHDSFDHPCVLPALIPLKHDPRMLHYADRPSPGQDHVSEHRPVSAQHRQRLLDLWWCGRIDT